MTIFNDSLLASPYLEQITFNRYIRLVLPVDGFIFWVKQSLINPLSPSLNGIALNELPDLTTIDDTIVIDGLFHYSTQNQQDNSQIYAKNSVLFTSSKKLDDFNELGESELLIGSIDGIQFAFNNSGNYYQKAGVWCYQGEAINPVMRSQIIDDVGQFSAQKICNDSLPLFMSRSLYAPIFPAFRGLQNLRPPYLSVDVLETKPYQQLASEETSERRQFCLDTVKVTCYGLNNNQVLDYIRYMVNEGVKNIDFGINNAPVAKKIDIPQSELNVTANAKEITFEVNYYQTRATEIAQKLIESALSSVSINPVLA